jgi:eukaryotic-like serine/threonine-protein kinase
MTTPGQGQAVIDGRFLLEGESRRGGMGTVWRARDLRTQQAIAVKILHDHGPDQVERFLREGALLADLRHPNVVSYLAHGTTADGVLYLAMEWLDGETVAERLARQPLTLPESLTLMRGVLRGLTVAHRRGIVHRDLKPSNLFLRQQRVDDVVLLDLGLARNVDASSDLTRTGSILGTPTYMAPEQVQGKGDVGPAADVFSLGCVLFECLAGRPPFVGAHVFSVLAKVLFEEPPRLAELRPEMPAGVDALVAGMLCKDPGQRPPDAAALLAAVDALGAVPELHAPGAPASPPRPPSGEQQLVGVILATRAAGRAGAEEPAPAPPPEPPLPDLSSYDVEHRRLADGTTVITLSQRSGSATDLAARAARCALRLRAARPDWTFVVATGRGILSERVHIGEAVDRAGMMLRELADRAAGGIWLDEVTAGLLDGRFHTTPAEGDAGLFLLAGEEPSMDPGRPLLGRPTTCVGRDHELAMLDLGLRACIEEQSPRAVLVVGPPGIGKSRLRHELTRHSQLRGQPLTLMLGLGDPVRSGGARGLLGGAVARLCGVRSEASDEVNQAAIAARIGDGADGLRTTVFMAELCGVPFPEEESPELRAARRNPNIMVDLLTEAWLAFLRAESAGVPVLLVLDDLQWSDPLTISLVAAALRGLTSSPLMVLALGRPEVLELFPELWAPRLSTMQLQPLGQAATTRLVRQALGTQVDDEGVARIVARAGGNALYLEELIRAAAARRDDIPGTVLAMLQARIGLLPASTRRVLRAASLFGEQFPLPAVEALLRAAGAEAELAPALAALQKHEILEQPAEDRGSSRWRFRHALMREAAYTLFTADDLTASHALAAQALEAIGEDPAVIASHHERGGDRARAVRHYVAAAEQAYRRNDLETTVALVDRGLACGPTGDERAILRAIEAPARFYRTEFVAGASACDEAMQLLPAGHRLRTRTLALSAYIAMHLGQAIQAEAQIEELLAAESGEAERANHVLALADLFPAYVALGDRRQAGRVLARIATLRAQIGESDPLSHAWFLYWQTRFIQMLGDDVYAAWQSAQRTVALFGLCGDRRMYACAQVEVGECARRLFSVSEGVAIMRQAVRRVEQVREPVITAFVQQYLAALLAEARARPRRPARG